MDDHHSSSSSRCISSYWRRKNILLILLNGALLAIGNIGGPLIMRLYYLHGGKMIWLNSWLETAGWPVMFVSLIISSIHRRRIGGSSRSRFVTIGLRESMVAAGIGILIGTDDYFHTWGVANLPMSTATMILATELGFTALFAFFIVSQRFSPFSINAIFLLMAGAGVLATNTKSDWPAKGVISSRKDYVTGFVMCLATAALYGLILPLIEVTYKNATKQPITYTLVMEIQLVICLFANGFCTVGTVINRDFQGIGKEAERFELGEKVYYVLLILTAVSCQCFYLGTIGIVFCASSLLSAILISCSLPITEILGVVVYDEPLTAQKGFSFGLCLWGCLSYFYGEYRSKNKMDSNQENLSTSIDSQTETQTVVVVERE